MYKTVAKRNYKRPQANKKAKRWYLDARIGKNVPIVGGSGLRLGTRAVKQLVRREMHREDETKFLSSDIGLGNTLTHNTIFTVAPTRFVVQGTGENSRLGNQVFLRYIRLQGFINNLSTQPEVRYRFMCIESTQDLAGGLNTNANWQSGFGSSDIFITSSTPLINSFINNKLEGVKVITDRQLVVRQDIATQVKVQKFSIDCRVMRKVTYKGTGFSGYQDVNYYFVIIPYVDGGLGGTTVVGNVNLNYLVTYTDS